MLEAGSCLLGLLAWPGLVGCSLGEEVHGNSSIEITTSLRAYRLLSTRNKVEDSVLDKCREQADGGWQLAIRGMTAIRLLWLREKIR